MTVKDRQPSRYLQTGPKSSFTRPPSSIIYCLLQKVLQKICPKHFAPKDIHQPLGKLLVPAHLFTYQMRDHANPPKGNAKIKTTESLLTNTETRRTAS